MTNFDAKAFQRRFRAWLGADPEAEARRVAQQSGYSVDYVRWAAGLIGKKPWPGSEPFIHKMEELGCTDLPWHEQPAEALALAFRERVVLYGPEPGAHFPGNT